MLDFVKEVTDYADIITRQGKAFRELGIELEDLERHMSSLQASSLNHIDYMICLSLLNNFENSSIDSSGNVTVSRGRFSLTVSKSINSISIIHEEGIGVDSNKITNDLLSDARVTPLVTQFATCVSDGGNVRWDDYAKIKHELMCTVLAVGLELIDGIDESEIVEPS